MVELPIESDNWRQMAAILTSGGEQARAAAFEALREFCDAADGDAEKAQDALQGLIDAMIRSPKLGVRTVGLLAEAGLCGVLLGECEGG